MTPRTYLVCPSCGSSADLDSASHACSCGDLFELAHSFPALSREHFAGSGRSAHGVPSGVWRFKSLIHPSLEDDEIVSLGEGWTPLYTASAVADYVGLERCSLKHEGMNPTGSFKDRGMTVAVSQARHVGARRVVCASTGNTAASLAAYASAAGMQGVILVPEAGTALSKLSQAMAYGARTIMLRGDFDAAMGLLREMAGECALYLCNSLNPFRLEGQKSIVLELLAQRDWQVPDWICLPAGNLGNTAAFGKALREVLELGLIDRMPRLAAVQALGAAPFLHSFERGFDSLTPVSPKTLASAIRIGNPVSYLRAVRSIRATAGRVCAVEDAAILDAKAVVDGAGVGAEPASCASVAGARQLVERGVIARDADVVCVLTGHLMKDAQTTLAYHQGELKGIASERANRPIVIDASADALRAAVAEHEPTR